MEVHDLRFKALIFPWPKMSVCWTICSPAYAAYNSLISEKICELTFDGNLECICLLKDKDVWYVNAPEITTAVRVSVGFRPFVK